MSSLTKTGNVTHDNTCNALGVVQASIAGVTSQATINSAYLTFYRAKLASSIANNNRSDIYQIQVALKSLGVNV